MDGRSGLRCASGKTPPIRVVRSAEELTFGNVSTGAQDDLQRATDMTRYMITAGRAPRESSIRVSSTPNREEGAMISRRCALQTTLGAMAALMVGRAPDADAQPYPGRPVRSMEIFRQVLPNVPGKEVVVVSVDYAPGAGSTKHRHPGPVFGYVVRGAIVSQLGTEPPVTYEEGEMWYEPPGAAHSTSRNASETGPAKLLTFFVADQKQVLTEPIGM
jgi:quercetin dioxygenase-like cupin family protein